MSMMGPGELCRAALDDHELTDSFGLESDSAFDFLAALLVGPDPQERVLAESALTQLTFVMMKERPLPIPLAIPDFAMSRFVPALAGAA